MIAWNTHALRWFLCARPDVRRQLRLARGAAAACSIATRVWQQWLRLPASSAPAASAGPADVSPTAASATAIPASTAADAILWPVWLDCSAQCEPLYRSSASCAAIVCCTTSPASSISSSLPACPATAAAVAASVFAVSAARKTASAVASASAAHFAAALALGASRSQRLQDLLC